MFGELGLKVEMELLKVHFLKKTCQWIFFWSSGITFEIYTKFDTIIPGYKKK